MNTVERLKSTLGANIAESISVTRAAPSPGFPTEADRYAGVTRLKGANLIPVEAIEPDPDQPRKEFDPEALRQLADSLRDHGQLQPVRVRYAGGRWVLVAGERRWRAAKLAGLARLACVEEDRELSAEDKVDLQLTENCLRDDLKPVEQATAFQTLMNKRNWSQAQLAEHLHLSRTKVSRALALLTLPEGVKEAVDSGRVSAEEGYKIARTADPVEHEELVRAAVTERPAPRLKRVFNVRNFRVTVHASRHGASEADVAAALAEALKLVKGRGAV